MTTRLSATQRTALKAQILRHAITANVPDLTHIRATLRNASKAELLNYAQRFAILLDTLLPSGTATPEDVQACVDDGDDANDDTAPDAPAMPAHSTDVQRDVDAVDPLWAS